MSRRVSLVLMPFHAATAEVGMGRGPRELVDRHGLAQAVGAAEIREIAAAPEIEHEVARTFELDRRLAAAVRDAVAASRFPLVLAGNCISCLATAAGADADGVLWLDAHADFDTPDDNVSGFLDVMALAILTGNAWHAQHASIDASRPIEERNVVLVGVRDLFDYQRLRLQHSQIRLLTGSAGLEDALDALAGRVRRLYLHVDLDCLDPSQGRANQYAAPGGLTTAELQSAIGAAFDRFDVCAAALTAYDPAVDADGTLAANAVAVATEIARRAA